MFSIHLQLSNAILMPLFLQRRPFSSRFICSNKQNSMPCSTNDGWNSSDEFFRFTPGRFIVDEVENLRKREVRFGMNKLALVAADSIGAAQCVSIKEYPDGMFNKAFLMTMDDGGEAVAKVPNPNAGIPHFTTASEVATMDFVSSEYPLIMTTLANAINLEGQRDSWYSSSASLHLELACRISSCGGRVCYHG